jgi:hypothetical protein
LELVPKLNQAMDLDAIVSIGSPRHRANPSVDVLAFYQRIGFPLKIFFDAIVLKLVRTAHNWPPLTGHCMLRIVEKPAF